MRKTPVTGTLPLLDASLLLVAWKLELERDERGQEWCFKSGIGGIRRHKIGIITRNIEVRGNVVPLVDFIEEPRNAARTLMTAMCARCPFVDCPLHGK